MEILPSSSVEVHYNNCLNVKKLVQDVKRARKEAQEVREETQEAKVEADDVPRGGSSTGRSISSAERPTLFNAAELFRLDGIATR
ncbi:hypothetical protein BG011_002105, partial [Mortierella polycephala]